MKSLSKRRSGFNPEFTMAEEPLSIVMIATKAVSPVMFVMELDT
jgi:hypothetical protein